MSGPPAAESAEAAAAAAAAPMVAEVAAPVAEFSAAESQEVEVLVVDSPAAVDAVKVGDVAAAVMGGSVGEAAEGGTDRMLSLRTSLENWFRKDEVPLERERTRKATTLIGWCQLN